MKNLVFLLLFVLVTIPGLRAEKIKFKAITKKELNVDKCDFYPEAKAVMKRIFTPKMAGSVIPSIAERAAGRAMDFVFLFLVFTAIASAAAP